MATPLKTTIKRGNSLPVLTHRMLDDSYIVICRGSGFSSYGILNDLRICSGFHSINKVGGNEEELNEGEW